MYQAIPALPVKDTNLSTAFYRENLGFTLTYREDGFAILQCNGVEIHLWVADDEEWRSREGSPAVVSGAESFIAGTASCRVGVEGVDKLYGRIQPDIVHPNARLGDTAWGTREFSVLDPDNNLITFFERL